MKRTLLTAIPALLSLCVATGSVRAEDIDIYAGAGANAALPNVLFVFDNAAAFSASVGGFTCTYPASAGGGIPSLNGTAAGIQQCALVAAIASIPEKTVNIGLMVYNENQMTGSEVIFAGDATGTPVKLECGDGTGGCLIQPLAEMNADNKKRLINFIKSWKDSGTSTSTEFNIKSNTKRTGAVMQEAWAYYAGSTGISTRDYSGIQPPVGCQQNYVIFIGNAVGTAGSPGDGSGSDVEGALKSAPGVTSAQLAPKTITYPPDAACNAKPYYTMPNHTVPSGLWADEWSRYMKGSDLYSTIGDQQNITTYTIGVLDLNTCKADFPALLTSMAAEGGGDYFATTDYSSLALAIATILNKIQAVNSAFASASLPISVNTQGTYLNQVYMGMFRPDADGNPRWQGNLKQYQFATDTACAGCSVLNPRLFLAGADGRAAISGDVTSGFIAADALSFWTSSDVSKLPDSAGGFWKNSASDFKGYSGGYDKEDGNIVEKGGVSQQIRLENLFVDYAASPAGPRRLYTCVGGGCTANALLSSMPFATTNTNLTATTLGISNPTYYANVSTISRDSATGVVTVTFPAAPSPAISNPATAILSGSNGGQFNGTLASYGPATPTATTLTYALPSETPPTSATGTYEATGPAAGTSDVTSLTRTSNSGKITVTATLGDITFQGGANVGIGDVIAITGSSGYNGSHTVTNASGMTIEFTMSDSPPAKSGTGDLWIGASCDKSGKTANCDSFSDVNTNAPGVGTPPGLVRGRNDGLVTTAGSHVLMVTFSKGTAISYGVGSTAKIQNNADGYNSATGYRVAATGSGCSVTVVDPTSGTQVYTGTASTTAKTGAVTTYTVCLDLGTSFPHVPSISANGATSGKTTATRQNPSVTKIISALTRGASGCPASRSAEARVETASAHGFNDGETVTISGTPGTGESAYLGAYQITVVDTKTFTYKVQTSPACTDSTAGMKVAYQSSLGGVSETDLIRWVRGMDNRGDERSPDDTRTTINIRPSVHGDVLHSRPAVIAYGSAPDVVVFYGANDGTLRAVNGNKTGSIGTSPAVPPGGELWSFIPTEFYSKMQRMYENTPVIKLYNTSLISFPDARPKDYFFDGAIGVYQDASLGKAHIYVSARRGGRFIYAIDVSDPAAPRFMWKRGCPNLADNTGCDAGFEELGQTWSQPKVAFVKGHTNPVLIFGAGYDAGEDSEPPAAATMGRGIFIVDAINGSLLWRAGPGGTATECIGTPCLLAGMTYAMPSEVTLVDRDPDGKIDRLYVPDLGGNVWRVDLQPAGGDAPANWQVTKLASLGGSGTTKRKIFFAPDVVTTKGFDIVLVGTGDREHPVYANQSVDIVNRFYMLKDTNTGNDAKGATAIVDDTDAVYPSKDAPSDLFDATSAPYDNSLKGFFIRLVNLVINDDNTLGPDEERGEKVVNAPTTVGGRTFFGTNTPIPPKANVCQANLGRARGYSFNIITGEKSVQQFRGGGLPPSPVTGLVTVEVDGKPRLMPFLIGGGSPTCVGPDCSSPLGAIRPPIPIKKVRTRTYWYREYDKK